MADMENTAISKSGSSRVQRHRGRGAQALIYFGKLARMFLYQNDWKVIPMSAIIAALVSLVVRNGFFATMEGTLKGAFALTCVAIWNGSFNSILVICRERNIIKREHRSGLHITAYVLSHMAFQLLLCLVQAGITMYVFSFMGVKFPEQRMMTQWMIVDIGITVFIISYASDMLSLFVSSIVHSTTTAMTVMPFILIVQLVFSGGIFSLPAWSDVLSQFTISNYGLKCVAAQADYNSLPMDTAWKTIEKLSDNRINRSYTVGEITDFLRDESNTTIMGFRETEVNTRELVSVLVGEEYADMVSMMTDLDDKMTVGEVIDALADNPVLLEQRERTVDLNMTVGEIVDLIGRDEAIGFIDRVLDDGGCGIKVRTRTELVVEELFVNIAKYAYEAEGGKVYIKAGISEEPHTLTISFADSGKEFDPLSGGEADTPALPSEHGIGGLGLFLVKKNMDDIKYERSDGMNILTVSKVL